MAYHKHQLLPDVLPVIFISGCASKQHPMFAQIPETVLRINNFIPLDGERRKNECKEQKGFSRQAETDEAAAISWQQLQQKYRKVPQRIWDIPYRILSSQSRKEGLMNTANLPQKADYKPLVLVDTENLPREEWLSWRRKGIGGSDVAAIMGISPFRTARDIYYDKLNIAPVEEDETNWVAKEMGHLLEDLVAKIFHKKTGYEVYQVKKMFYHPLYPFMLADVDYFVKMPDGTTAILEIKTTNYNAKDSWWLNEKKIVPVYYEVQGRHYMAVTNIDRVFFCCLYGNTEDEIIIREIVRDAAYEEEMIFLEQNFWENHVTAKTPPPYLESGNLALESVLKNIAPADKSAPAVNLHAGMRPILQRYVELETEYRLSDRHARKLENDLKQLRATLIAEMGESCTAQYEQDGYSYIVTSNPVSKPGINKDNLLLLELEHPDLYKRYVTTSKWRNFKVKVSAENAA